MTDKILEDIRDELVAIRLLLAAKPAQASAPAAQSSGADEPIPQPSELVAEPGAVEVHFGKNTGKRIDDLTERQLGWYAKEPEPRLDNSGKPFPPRAQDVALRNACRQLWHSRKGTLAGAPQPPRAAPQAKQAQIDEENIPF